MLILGAGFSRAISDHMPMTGELGDEAIDRLRSRGVPDLPSRTFSGPQLEAWLSRLAEPQPDLSAARNLANQSLFLLVSEALRDVIVERQTTVHAGNVPWWLRRMLGSMHYSRSNVVTFNYDTLVETAISALGLWDDEAKRVYPSELICDMPPTRRRPSGGMSFGIERADTFRYMKLHGSVDTFWIPGDTTGASIGRWELPGAWGAPRIAAEEERRQVLPGTEAYIVPPAAAKSAFYANPLARELWRTSAEAIGNAKHVAVVGYSIPMTDLVTSGMLADALEGTTCEVTVVNCQPGPVVSRLVELGVQSSRIHQVGGADSVQCFAEELDQVFLPGLHHPGGEDLLLTIGWGRNPSVAVKRLVEVDSDGTATVAVGHESWHAASVRVRDLRGPAGPATKVKVVYDNGETAMVARALPENGGPDGPKHLVLAPTARP
ncbi:hypothetical protein ASG70_18440 [Phycicoccus sp. Soil748]|nr:hypothetical protein ASG70_18440 [Phycicoccus sp. Soil748]